MSGSEPGTTNGDTVADRTHPFEVGDYADRKDKELDPREVGAIGWMGDIPVIDLIIGTSRTGPIEADKYDRIPKRA